MSERSHIDRVWDIIENVAVCMLTTRFEGGLRARPLEVRPDRSSNRLLFVTDVHSPKREEVERWPEVGLVFIDAAQRAYLSVTGQARIEDDNALTAAAWRENDEVWWPGGPTDADVCVLVVEPITAELWDGPSSAAVAACDFAKARATGTEPNLGENRKISVELKNQCTAGRRMPGRTDSAVAHTPVRSMHGPCKDRVTGSAVQAIRPPPVACSCPSPGKIGHLAPILRQLLHPAYNKASVAVPTQGLLAPAVRLAAILMSPKCPKLTTIIQTNTSTVGTKRPMTLKELLLLVSL